MSASPTHSLFEGMDTEAHPETTQAASGRPWLHPINTQTPSHHPVESLSAFSHLNTTHVRESSSSPAQLGGYADTGISPSTSELFVGGFTLPGILFSAAPSTGVSSPWGPSSAAGIYDPSSQASAFAPGDTNFKFSVEYEGDEGIAPADTYGHHRSASLNGSTESLLNVRWRSRPDSDDDSSDGSNYGSPGPSSPNSAYSSPYHSPHFPPTPDSMAPPMTSSIDISDQSPGLDFDIRRLSVSSDMQATIAPCTMGTSPTGSSSSALEGVSPSQMSDTTFGAMYSQRQNGNSFFANATPSPSTTLQHTQPAPYHAITRGREESAIVKRRTTKAMFKCTLCPISAGVDFTTEMRRKAHIESHHRGQRYACNKCHKVYKHATSRDRHCKKEHGETYYRANFNQRNLGQ